MDLQDVFWYLAWIFGAASYVPYIYSIVWTKKGKPVRVTWCIWATIDVILACQMYSEDKLNGQIASSAVGATTIFLLSLFYGKSGWSWLDPWCFLGALVSVVIWKMYDSTTWGIVLACVANIIGVIPTAISAWEDYRRKSRELGAHYDCYTMCFGSNSGMDRGRRCSTYQFLDHASPHTLPHFLPKGSVHFSTSRSCLV